MRLYLFIVFCIVLVQHNILSMDFQKNIHVQPGVTVLATSQDGYYIAAGYCDGAIGIADLLNTNSHVPKIDIGIKSPVTAIAVGSSFIAIGYATGELYVCDYTARTLSYFRAHEKEIRAIAIDNSLVATAGLDGCIKVFDLDRPNLSYQPYCTCIVRESKKVRALALDSHTGLLAISRDRDNVLTVWNIANDRCYADICAAAKPIACYALHGTVVWISTYDGYLNCWDLLSGKCIKSFTPNKAFLSLCLSADKENLLCVAQDKNVYVYNCSSGALVNECLPSDQFVQRTLVSERTAVYSYAQGGIEVLSVAPIRFSLKNDLDYPLQNISLVGRDKCEHKIADACKAHDFIRICLNFLTDASSSYYLRMDVGDATKVIGPLPILPGTSEMLLTQDIMNAHVILQVAMRVPDKCELRLAEYKPKEPWISVPAKEKKLSLMAYVVGVVLHKFLLTDSLGGIACAKQRGASKSMWYFDDITCHGPYTMHAETDGNTYERLIPYLPDESELFIMCDPRVKENEKQRFCLRREDSYQMFQLPGMPKVQGSPIATLQSKNKSYV